jgi:hypothetical protein
VGELVRQGQEEGTIRKHGDDTRTDLVDRVQLGLRSPSDAAGEQRATLSRSLYSMADATPDDFDAAIDEAKAEAEGNLSRANAVRKVKGCSGGRGPRYRQGPPAVPPRNDPTPQADTGAEVEPCVQYGGVVGPVERKVPPPNAPGPAPNLHPDRLRGTGANVWLPWVHGTPGRVHPPATGRRCAQGEPDVTLLRPGAVAPHI